MAVDSPKFWATPRGRIPQEDWLPGVSYRGETNSQGFATQGRYDEQFGSMTPRGIIPRRDWLCEVWYPGESCFGRFLIDSLGYHTPVSHWKILQNMTPRGMIPQRVMRFKKNLIVLFIVSLESDVIETSIFLNCKTYIKITFYSLLLLYFELLSV